MGWGAAAMVGGQLLGGILKNDADRTRAHEAQDFSAQQYATRWQTTVKDMQAAGLNPMLSYSQGVGNSPQGIKADYTDPIGPALTTGIKYMSQKNQRDVNTAQVANINADTENKAAQADLIQAQTALALSSAGQADASIGQIDATTKKIVEETKNIPWEGDRIRQVTQQIAAETRLTDSQEHGLRLTWPQIEAITRKVLAETDLLNLDVDAAKAFDNFGNEAKQLRPVIELIKGLIHIRNSK